MERRIYIQLGGTKGSVLLSEYILGLEEYWIYELNDISLSPGKSIKQRTEAWWHGSCIHEWKDSIKNMGKLIKTGLECCPYCDNRMVLSGFSNLATIRPGLAALWHPTKNRYLTPATVLPSYKHSVWWQGTCGHLLESSVKLMVKQPDSACGLCPRSNKKASEGGNTQNQPRIIDLHTMELSSI